MKKLLENAWIVTMNPDRRIYKKGYILVEDRLIKEVRAGEYTGDRSEIGIVRDMSGKIILPGFVNAHSHMAGSLFKGLLEDDPDGFYMYALPMELNLTAEDVYYLTLAGSYESLAAGITTANEIYHFADSVAAAMEDIGIRGVISQNIVDVNIGRIGLGDYTRDEKKGMAFLEDNIRLIEKYHGRDGGRITCRVGPHATDTVSLDLAKKCVETAKKYNVGLHMHTAQMQRENDVVMREYGMTPVEYMEAAGLLGPQTMAAHCCYVNDSDIKKLSDSGTHMLHCTKSFATDNKFPPMKKIFEAGVDVVLGTDWVTQDPWINLRYAVGLNRHCGVGYEYTNAHTLLERFTIKAAQALGMGDEIGSIEPGKQADLQVIDLMQPHLVPVYDDPVPLLVYNACRSDVSDVMVAGKFVIRDRELTTMSRHDILKDAQRTADRLYRLRNK